MDLDVRGLTKRFQGTQGRLALDRVQFRVAAGEMVALIGASGSGKSTLLRHISGLITADSGEIRVGGEAVQAGGRLAPNLRSVRSRVGVIFQQFNLVERLSLLTNVLAGAIHRTPGWRTCLLLHSREQKLAGLEALERVGLAEFALQRASTLSGGQQQRAAIARTLVQKARLILGDEPIASLDPNTARLVMDALAQINREDGTTCIVSLHQVDYAIAYCPRTIALSGGRVVFDGPSRELSRSKLEEIYGGALPNHGSPLPGSVANTEPPLEMAASL